MTRDTNEAERKANGNSPLQEMVETYLDHILEAFDIDQTLVEWIWRMLPPPLDASIIDSLSAFAGTRFPPAALEKLIADTPSPKALLGLFFSEAADYKISLTDMKRSLRQVWSLYRHGSGGKERKSRPGNAIHGKLQSMLGLSPEELRIVAFICCANTHPGLEQFCGGKGRLAYFNCMSVCTQIPLTALRDALSCSGKLLSSGIVRNDDDFTREYTVDADVSDLFTATGSARAFNRLVVPDEHPTFGLRSFPVTSMQVRVCRDLLGSGRPCHILLRGDPGTGKTEFARSLVRAAGRSGFFLAFPGEDSIARRRRSLHLAAQLLSRRKAVLIVDEADSLLNTELFFAAQADKGWLTEFLDRSPVATIWISNSVENTHEAVLRRFSYNLVFRPFSRRERLNLFRAVRRNHPLRELLSERLLSDLAAHYRVSAGGIACALRSLSDIYRGLEPSKDEVHRTLEELLVRHSELIERGVVAPAHGELGYDIELLNTDPSAKEVLLALRRNLPERRGKRDGDRREEIRRRGANLLLWGPPGTGKTAFARHLAEKLQIELVVRRSSDLQSYWSGETEKNIRKAFEEASRDRSALFLDEADTFFFDRRYAQHSWETSQTNELLTWMENHSGILICATNMIDRLDQASMRRFAWKVEFKALAAVDRFRAYRRFFCLSKQLSAAQVEELSQISNLTLGDLHAVRERSRWASPRDHGSVLADLRKEIALRRGNESAVGFRT